MKIAVIGAGISGLSAAWQLSRDGHRRAEFAVTGGKLQQATWLEP